MTAAYNYIIAAYGVTAAALLGYLVFLYRQQSRLQRTLETLTQKGDAP